MSLLPLHQRIYYRCLGLLYGFAYWTSSHSFIFRWSTWVKLLAFAPLIWVWRQNRSVPLLILALLMGGMVLWLYWRAWRVGYKKFVAGETAVSHLTSVSPILPDQRIPHKASGIFGVADREEQVLLKPAEYWQVPLGDHTIMVQSAPGRFLYQFFNADNLQNVRTGWLVHGFNPQPVLAITFYSAWGSSQLSLRELYQAGGAENHESKLRTIYLLFENDADGTAVRHMILDDVREK
jgi:hypothetical protein